MDGNKDDDKQANQQQKAYNFGDSGIFSKDNFSIFLATYCACIVMVIAFIAWKIRGYSKINQSFEDVINSSKYDDSTTTYARPRPVQRERADEEPVGVRRRGGRARIRDAARRQQEEEEERSQVDQEDDKPEIEQTSAKIGAKKQKKLEEKEERRRAREAAERERIERRKEQAERDVMLKKEEEKKKLEEAKQAEAEKKMQEEKERKEHEEYLKLKEMFMVEEEGQAETSSEEQSQNMLLEFVNYIKESKVVLLEDLASHFGLRTQEAIDRVQDLLKDEILTGVIDDRGKFIYISSEELKAVAEFVEQRGRVSISELARASNSLINLKPEKSLTLSS